VAPEYPAVQRQRAVGAGVQPARTEQVREVVVEARRPLVVLVGQGAEAALAALRQAGLGK
jgi:hypothetical protein